MSTGDQEDQAEKLRVTLQDADVRRQQQGSTFHQHAQSMADETNRAGSPPPARQP